MSTIQEPIYFASSDEERSALQQLESVLQANALPMFLESNGKAVALPPVILQLLRIAVTRVAHEQGIILLSAEQEVTLSAAAELLNVSLAYMSKLVATNEIPATIKDSQYSIQATDLALYQQKRHAMQLQAINEIAQLSQDSGSYD